MGSEGEESSFNEGRPPNKKSAWRSCLHVNKPLCDTFEIPAQLENICKWLSESNKYGNLRNVLEIMFFFTVEFSFEI